MKTDDVFYCLIVGSRGFTDYELFSQKVDLILSNQDNVEIVSGGARGADSLGKRYAEEKGYKYKEFPADWETHGKSAGFVRNAEMHEYISKQERRGCIMFWDGKSKGTAHSFELAKKYNNPLRVIRVTCK